MRAGIIKESLFLYLWLKMGKNQMPHLGLPRHFPNFNGMAVASVMTAILRKVHSFVNKEIRAFGSPPDSIAGGSVAGEESSPTITFH